MKKILLCALVLTTALGLFAQVYTCHDIQYTTSASGDSPYVGRTVTVRGIVVVELFYTGTNTSNIGFFISDPEGGPWSGLLIYTNQYHPQRGDEVEVTGTITEYYNFTEMSPTTGYRVISQGNPIPPPTLINTGDLSSSTTAEQWEGVFVKVENVTIVSLPTSYNEFYVNDGTGQCQIDDQCFPRTGFSWPQMTVGERWARIQGVVDYSFSNYAINPRDMNDIVKEDNVSNAMIKVQTTTADINTEIDIPILTSRIKPEWFVSSYTTNIKIDASKVKFNSVKYGTGTMTAQEPTVELSEDGSLIHISYQSMEPITSIADEDVLFKLCLKPVDYGESVIDLVSFFYDNTQIQALTDGKILVPIRKSIAWLNIKNPSSNKNIFNPELNEKLTIEYGCKSSSSGINVKAIVRIYDAQGRLVATPINKNISSPLGIESFQWDGRDYMMRRVPIGLYYCHLEIIERSTGHKEETVQPIVVKSIMK
ncbi:MAG TPA: hypothetical protein PKW22_05720 [Candidatus Syntrophosphaera thermopropionivorans]|nr:hypothetical protein [Candidatus Syntrophosphaera thermopropionivorans]